MYLFKLSPPKIDMTFLKFPPEALPIFCSPPEIEMYLFKIPRGANRYDFSQGSAGGAADFLSASGNRDVFFKLLPPILRLLFSRSRQRRCHFFCSPPKINKYLFNLPRVEFDMTILKFPPGALPIFCSPPEIEMYLFKLPHVEIDMTFRKFLPEVLPIFCSPPEIDVYLFKLSPPEIEMIFASSCRRRCRFFDRLQEIEMYLFKLLQVEMDMITRSRRRRC
jgi:hypothetical protein